MVMEIIPCVFYRVAENKLAEFWQEKGSGKYFNKPF